MKYQFVAKHQGRYPVRRICALLGISRSGYYAWRNRKPSQREHHMQILINHIQQAYKRSRKTYGSPRVYAQLKKQGIACNQKTVAKYMRQEGLKGQRKYRRVVTTNSKHDFPVAPNLLNREFQAERPQSEMGQRYHLHSDSRRLAVPGWCIGFVFAESGRVGNVQFHRC